MEQQISKLTQDQIHELDQFLQSPANRTLSCPNHPNSKTLESYEDGVRCTRCDHKISVEKIDHLLTSLV